MVTLSIRNTNTEVAISGNYRSFVTDFFDSESGLNIAVDYLANNVIHEDTNDPTWRAFIGDPNSFQDMRTSNEEIHPRPGNGSYNVLIRHSGLLYGDPNGDYIWTENTTSGYPIEIVDSVGQGGTLQTRIRWSPAFSMPETALWSHHDVKGNGVSGGILGEGYLGTPCAPVADIMYGDPFANIDYDGDTGIDERIELDAHLYPFEQIRDNIKSRGDVITIPPGDYSTTAYGTELNPGVFYCPGDLDLRAVTGYGILVVDGDLELSGNLLWKGLFLIGGNFRFSGGGNKEIFGSVVTMGETIQLNGSVFIYYDCEVLNDLFDKKSGFSREYWRVVF